MIATIDNLQICIPLGIITALLLLAFLKANTKICPPNQVLIFSGRSRKVGDKRIGYKIVKGRAFRFPIFEAVHSMSLDTIPIEIDVTALSKDKISINVKGIANVKIAGTEEEGLGNAVERFLGRSNEEISRIARQTLEGSLRGIFSTVSPEEANTNRLDLAKKVIASAQEDFQKLGLVIDTFKIQNLTDGQKYLEAIGRKKNALVQRDAKITEAQADADARVEVSKQKEKGALAELAVEKNIAQASNDLLVFRANLAVLTNQAEAKAKVAGEIVRAVEETKLEEQKITLNEKKCKADVIIPAEADKSAKTLKAIGDAAKIVENGKATAEAIRLMNQQWEKGNTRELFLIQQLPDIIGKITNVISDNLSIEKLTIVDSGNGDGLARHVRGLTAPIVSVFEEVKNATGLDIPDILQGKNKKGSEIKKELS